jgi:hypothetical protein
MLPSLNSRRSGSPCPLPPRPTERRGRSATASPYPNQAQSPTIALTDTGLTGTSKVFSKAKQQTDFTQVDVEQLSLTPQVDEKYQRLHLDLRGLSKALVQPRGTVRVVNPHGRCADIEIRPAKRG